MFTVNFVNFLQVGLLTLSLFGILLLFRVREFRQICILLGLVAIASLFNLLEEVWIARQYYLITPVFILGFGPAIYLATRELVGDKVSTKSYLHLLPMFISLPFTHLTSTIIAIGTLWRIIYAGFTLKKLYVFKDQVINFRSDAGELSIRWLIWAIYLMTFVSMANLVRLNFQVELGYQLNVIGQGISTGISLLFFTILIYHLINKKEAILSLITDNKTKSLVSTSEPEQTQIENKESNNESADDYKHIFDHLSQNLEQEQWFKIQRLTLQQLSELSGFQTRDISRAINLVGNSNFNDFINQYRLKYVTESMRDVNEKSMLELALEAGFNAKSTFNTTFKRVYSMTPAEFKAKLTP